MAEHSESAVAEALRKVANFESALAAIMPDLSVLDPKKKEELEAEREMLDTLSKGLKEGTLKEGNHLNEKYLKKAYLKLSVKEVEAVLQKFPPRLSGLLED